MKEIDWSVISTVISSVTAVIAIIAPVVSSAISVKSQERSKNNELYVPRVYDALADMSVRYSQLPRLSTANNVEEMHVEYLEALERHREFRASCYTVMSLMPGERIQQQIIDLLGAFEGSLSPNESHDKLFCQLMNDITEYLRTSMVKKPKKYAKDQS